MTWPSPQLPLPTNQTNATVQLNTHPQDHANANQAINDDIAPQIEQNRVDLLDLPVLRAEFEDHEDSAWQALASGNMLIEQPPNPPYSAGTTGTWQVRHGTFTAFAVSTWGTITDNTGSNLSTYITPPVTGNTTVATDNMIVGSGLFRAAGPGTPYYPVTGLWVAADNWAWLIRQDNFSAVGLPPLQDNGWLYFTWSMPTARADS